MESGEWWGGALATPIGQPLLSRCPLLLIRFDLSVVVVIWFECCCDPAWSFPSNLGFCPCWPTHLYSYGSALLLIPICSAWQSEKAQGAVKSTTVYVAQGTNTVILSVHGALDCFEIDKLQVSPALCSCALSYEV